MTKTGNMPLTTNMGLTDASRLLIHTHVSVVLSLIIAPTVDYEAHRSTPAVFMSTDVFNISWFIIFIVVIVIACMANIIIIAAILRDKSMHTSTYFYLVNVNLAEIMLVLCCLPERLAVVFRSNDGFQLGMLTCK